MKLYIGNIPFTSSEADLKSFFEAKCGPVKSITIIKDRDTDRSKGFGFVEFESDEDAQRAIETANNPDKLVYFGGRKLTINEARPRGNR